MSGSSCCGFLKRPEAPHPYPHSLEESRKDPGLPPLLPTGPRTKVIVLLLLLALPSLWHLDLWHLDGYLELALSSPWPTEGLFLI